MIMGMKSDSAARSTKLNFSHIIRCCHQFSTHRRICLSVVCFTKSASIQPTANKSLKSSSSIEDRYEVGIMFAWIYVPFYSTCFLCNSLKCLNSMKSSVETSSSTGRSTQSMIISVIVSPISWVFILLRFHQQLQILSQTVYSVATHSVFFILLELQSIDYRHSSPD